MPSNFMVWLTSGSPGVGGDLEITYFNSISQSRERGDFITEQGIIHPTPPPRVSWFPAWCAKMFKLKIFGVCKTRDVMV